MRKTSDSGRTEQVEHQKSSSKSELSVQHRQIVSRTHFRDQKPLRRLNTALIQLNIQLLSQILHMSSVLLIKSIVSNLGDPCQ